MAVSAWYLVLLTVLNTLGQGAENVGIVLWFEKLGPLNDAYATLLQTGCTYAVFFWLVMVVYVLWNYKHGASFTGAPVWLGARPFAESFLVGLANSLNGLFIIFASPASRTEPLIQSVLGNTTIFFSWPLSRWMLGERRSLCDWRPLVALLLVFGGTVISLWPSFSDSVHTSDTTAIWSLIFLLGTGFGALYNVMQAWWAVRLNRRSHSLSIVMDTSLGTTPGATRGDDPSGGPSPFAITETGMALHILCWQCTWLVVIYVFLFPYLDFVPWFGQADSWAEFWRRVTHTMNCSYWADSKCLPAAWWGLVFNGGYILSFWVAFLLNLTSPNFTMLIQLFVPIVVSAFWLIFPSLNPSADHTPLWSVIPSLILSVVGVFLWKMWEREDEKAGRAVSVASAGAYGAGGRALSVNKAREPLLPTSGNVQQALLAEAGPGYS